MKREALCLLPLLVFSSMHIAADAEVPDLGIYAGFNGGAYYLDPDTDGIDSTDGTSLGLQLGAEDKTWALEAKFFALRSNDDVPDKTTDLTKSVAVVYRTPTKNETYVKYKLGSYRFENDNFGSSSAIGGIGYGWKLEEGERLEIEYEYTVLKDDTAGFDIDVGLHMVTLQYLLGGSSDKKTRRYFGD